MRKILMTVLLAAVLIVGSIGTAMAESILFPYIANSDGNVDTIITVINTAPTAVSPNLHYRYFTKSPGVNENVNPCNEYNFLRPTTQNDIVSFAVGRNSGLGGGNAMFGDPTNYNTGVGAPNFGHIHGSGRFGYLMVTTANAGLLVGANAPDVSVLGAPVGAFTATTILDGEASLYDIATGAMWGYRGLPSNADANVAGTSATINSYAFSLPNVMGASTTVLQENIALAALATMPKISIYPPNQFTNRLFVTPTLDGGLAAAPVVGNADMRFANTKATRVALFTGGFLGMFDRNEQTVSSGGPLDVRCVGRLGAIELLGGAIGPLNPTTGPLWTVGGWAYLDLQDPGAIAPAPAVAASTAGVLADNSAAVYELKFGNVTGTTGMVNDGKQVVDWLFTR